MLINSINSDCNTNIKDQKCYTSPIQLLLHYVLAILYVILSTGLSSNWFSCFFQITGILASLVSDQNFVDTADFAY